MATIALYKLTDWPVSKHVLPLLRALGIPDGALERPFYFYPTAAQRPFADLPEKGGQAENEKALLALSRALAMNVGNRIVSPTDVPLSYGFHWSASEEELAAHAEKAGHEVVRARDAIAAARRDSASPREDRKDLDALRETLGGLVDKKALEAAMAYAEKGGDLPELPLHREAQLAMESLPEAWGEIQERILRVFVALTGASACPVYKSWLPHGSPLLDSAGLLAEKLRTLGVSETAILRKLLEKSDDGETGHAFGHPRWVSRHFLLAGWLGRLDEVAALGEGQVKALFVAQIGMPGGLRALGGIVAAAWCRAGRLEKLDLPSLYACRYLAVEDAFESETKLVYRRRVLAQAAPSVEQLLDVMRDARDAGALDAVEAQRFHAAWEAAVARGEPSLAEWEAARELAIISRQAFMDGLLAPFQRAVAGGFRKGEDGHGDNDTFMDTASYAAERDPDMALRGLVALSANYNEYGLRQYASEWNKVLPKKGYSAAAIAEASAHFSAPQRKSTAKILGKLLAARGIQVVSQEPPRLAKVDETFEIGTDVAHIVVGSFDAVERVAEVEDSADLPPVVKRQKCVCFATGGDGRYAVRVVGKAKRSARKSAELAATFPFAIKGDTLTVSGIVGSGGTPTIPFPSGTYVAEVLRHEEGPLDYTIEISPVDKPIKWTFGDELPEIY